MVLATVRVTGEDAYRTREAKKYRGMCKSIGKSQQLKIKFRIFVVLLFIDKR